MWEVWSSTYRVVCKLDADNVEYVVCLVTNDRMHIKKVEPITVTYLTEWKKQSDLS